MIAAAAGRGKSSAPISADRSLAPCKICGQPSPAFDVLDFGKSCHAEVYPLGIFHIPVLYRKCPACGFIFTDHFDDFSPDEMARVIYNDDYAVVDPAYAGMRTKLCASIIESQFSKKRSFGLDFGGGNGDLAAYLRAKGWQYDSYDPFGKNEMSDGLHGKYNVCSAFEVFEHMTDPVASMRRLLELVSPDKLVIVISTCLNDHKVSDNTRLSWWYAAPRNGHISLFSRGALKLLAKGFSLDYISFNDTTHFLTRGWSRRAIATTAISGKLRRIVRV